jgi:hypothetical protein
MRAEDVVGYANVLEKGIELMILITQVSLHGQDFSIK